MKSIEFMSNFDKSRLIRMKLIGESFDSIIIFGNCITHISIITMKHVANSNSNIISLIGLKTSKLVNKANNNRIDKHLQLNSNIDLLLCEHCTAYTHTERPMANHINTLIMILSH